MTDRPTTTDPVTGEQLLAEARHLAYGHAGGIGPPWCTCPIAARESLAASPQLREAIEFGLAWQRAEKALPKGFHAVGMESKPGWAASERYRALALHESAHGSQSVEGVGPTPAAALDALTTALEAGEQT